MPLMLAEAGAAALVSAGPLRTGVDPRVELLAVIFRLAGAPEYTQGRVPAYNAAVDSWFRPCRNHAAVQIAQALRQKSGIAYDAVMSLAIHVTDIDTLAERVPFDRPGITLDSRWNATDARRFLDAARGFVVNTRFRDFLAAQRILYDATDARLRELQLDMTWFDRFFGPRSVTAALVPGLLNGGGSYGVRVVDDAGAEEVYAIVGVWTTGADGLPAFAQAQVTTAVHEFAHSYANPLIDLYGAQLDPAGDRLYRSAQTQLQAQGYSSGRTVLYESLVRAASARYFAGKNGPAACDANVRYEHSRSSFIWTGEFTKLLFQYERTRDAWPTLETFMPRVAAFLDEASRDPLSMPARYEQSRPKVVDVSVTAGAADVNPELREIVVRFDRPMLPGGSVLPQTPDRFPHVAGFAFDQSFQVCTISVALEPGRDYEMSLNSSEAGWFASAEGVALSPYTVWFKTRAAEPHGLPRVGPRGRR